MDTKETTHKILADPTISTRVSSIFTLIDIFFTESTCVSYWTFTSYSAIFRKNLTGSTMLTRITVITAISGDLAPLATKTWWTQALVRF